MKTRTVRPSEQTTAMSREEYLALMSAGAPFAEFQNGYMVKKTAAQGRHGRAIQSLLDALWPAVRAKYRMQLYQGLCVDMQEYVYVPDLVFLRDDHVARYSAETGRIDGAPDLVIEVISHDSGSRDRIVKYNQYFSHGVPWYWIIDPFEYTLEEFNAHEAGYIRSAEAGNGHVFRPQAFPGIQLDASDIFGLED